MKYWVLSAHLVADLGLVEDAEGMSKVQACNEM